LAHSNDRHAGGGIKKKHLQQLRESIPQTNALLDKSIEALKIPVVENVAMGVHRKAVDPTLRVHGTTGPRVPQPPGSSLSAMRRCSISSPGYEGICGESTWE
jgi:hypothetical protein